MRILFATVMLLLVGAVPAVANYIQITNVSIAERNDADGYAVIQFDLSWENSWRTSIGDPQRDNWDAAWVFIKWIKTEDVDQDVAWSHAMLAASGHSIPSNTHAGSGLTTFTHALGRPDENSPYNATTNPYVGAFIHAEAPGAGHVLLEGVQLRWDYSYSGLTPTDQVDIKVFGIEMVYVPEGPFWVGTGGNTLATQGRPKEYASFFTYPDDLNDRLKPFFIDSEDEIIVGTDPGNFYYLHNNRPQWHGDMQGPIPAEFPKGFKAFYIMKYSVTQQAWVDFLNTLTAQQASHNATMTSSYRHSLLLIDGVYTTEHPFVAKNYVRTSRSFAYLAWAGLRPHTELEHEKAARGPSYPIIFEYAWGTRNIIPATGIINPGEANETAENSDANTVWNMPETIGGPLRVGAFGTSNSTREQSGTSYWGVHDMSGNVNSRIVSVGKPEGRAYTGLHGDGSISTEGWPNVEHWPPVINGEVLRGTGLRGGPWLKQTPLQMTISNRHPSCYDNVGGAYNDGCRGARSAPNQ